MDGKVIITMTTIPARIDTTLQWVIAALDSMSYDDYEIHINLPAVYEKTGEKYVVPTWLKDYKHVKVYDGLEDMGPKTKIIPTLMRCKASDFIITVDDDIIYNRNMIDYHMMLREKYPKAATGFSGTKDGRLILTPRTDVEVDILDNYKSASYCRWWFGLDFFRHYANQSWNDDLVVSAYLRDSGFKKIVCTYDSETFFYPRVRSFPIVNLMEMPMTGCDLFRGHAFKSSSPELQVMYDAIQRT